MLFHKKLIVLHQGNKAMYKTRNTETGNVMRGTRGMGWGGGVLYSGECHQTFRGILRNILGHAAKHYGECPQTFQGMSPNIPGNIAEHSRECPIYSDGRELVEASSITIVFSVALLILCSVIFCVKNLARLLAARLNSSENLISLP